MSCAVQRLRLNIERIEITVQRAREINQKLTCGHLFPQKVVLASAAGFPRPRVMKKSLCKLKFLPINFQSVECICSEVIQKRIKHS